jgi:hypothetical protein
VLYYPLHHAVLLREGPVSEATWIPESVCNASAVSVPVGKPEVRRFVDRRRDANRSVSEIAFNSAQAK